VVAERQGVAIQARIGVPGGMTVALQTRRGRGHRPISPLAAELPEPDPDALLSGVCGEELLIGADLPRELGREDGGRDRGEPRELGAVQREHDIGGEGSHGCGGGRRIGDDPHPLGGGDTGIRGHGDDLAGPRRRELGEPLDGLRVERAGGDVDQAHATIVTRRSDARDRILRVATAFASAPCATDQDAVGMLGVTAPAGREWGEGQCETSPGELRRPGSPVTRTS
jgi:hypothetical protein